MNEERTPKENEQPIVSETDTESAVPVEEKEPFVPSPKWKRVFAWILFAIVLLGIINWLAGIAFPTWTETLKQWLQSLT